MKTLKKSKSKYNKLNKLFKKYCKNENGLSKKEIIKLIKTEYKDNHSNNIIISLMNIWGKKIDGQYYITKEIFTEKLYTKPDGFFREKLMT